LDAVFKRVEVFLFSYRKNSSGHRYGVICGWSAVVGWVLITSTDAKDCSSSGTKQASGVTEIVGHQNSFVNGGELDAKNERAQGLITADGAGL
jgi:hypothetical protein